MKSCFYKEMNCRRQIRFRKVQLLTRTVYLSLNMPLNFIQSRFYSKKIISLSLKSTSLLHHATVFIKDKILYNWLFLRKIAC